MLAALGPFFAGGWCADYSATLRYRRAWPQRYKALPTVGVNQIRKIRSMNQPLKIVTIRIANVEGGGVRAWSDDLAELALTCPNHEALFAELTTKIASMLEHQGFHSKIVREFVVEVRPIQG